MRKRTLLLILIGLVLVVPVTFGIVWLTVDGNAVRRLVEREVQRQTGRKLTLAGPITFVPGWRPTVAVGGTTLANASWGSQPDMLKVEQLEASLKLGPLLGGKLELWGLTLKGVDLLLERNGDGTGNWVLDSAPSPEGTYASPMPVIEAIVLDGGTLTYRSAPGAPPRRLDIQRAEVEPVKEGGARTLALDGTYDSQPVMVTATAGPAGEGWRVQDLHLAVGSAQFDGSVDLPAGGQPRVAGNVQAAELVPLLKLAAGGGGGSGGFEALRALDADIQAKLGRAALAGLPLHDVTLSAKLQGGVLQIDPVAGQLGGGPMKASATVDAAASPARLGLKLDASDVGTAMVLGDLGLPVVLDARARLRGRFEGEGSELKEVVASLRGNASVYAGQGRVELPGGDDSVLQALAGTLLPQGAKGWGEIDCGAVVMSVRHGEAKIAAAIDSSVSTVRATGLVDLRNEGVDLSVVPSAKATVLSVGVPVRVTGTLEDPKVGLGENVLLEGVQAALAGILFPPAALAALVDVGASNTSACLAPAGAPASLPDKAVSTVKGVVEGVGQDLTDQLKSLLP
ncbi:MAG: AsmA family protein [Geminicoccaceae bacterium]